MIPKLESHRVHEASIWADNFQLVKQAYIAGLTEHFVDDIAFIGNASGIYKWEPAPIADIDLCVFFKTLTAESAQWLERMKCHLACEMDKRGTQFEFRLVNGPFKLTPDSIKKPVLVVHAAIYTGSEYLQEAPLVRWSWRKYTCAREPHRLARLAPPRPDLRELLQGRRGVHERLSCIRNARAAYWEQELPRFNWTEFVVTPAMNLFTEYCFAAGADTARNHGRVLGHPEADSLANTQYFDWYDQTLFTSRALRELVQLKLRTRNFGYKDIGSTAHRLAAEYLEELSKSLQVSIGDITSRSS